jgi:hypothetical protein
VLLAEIDRDRIEATVRTLASFGTRHTVDLSKDNVFFGVRAVNRAGLCSPVAFPAPQR